MSFTQLTDKCLGGSLKPHVYRARLCEKRESNLPRVSTSLNVLCSWFIRHDICHPVWFTVGKYQRHYFKGITRGQWEFTETSLWRPWPVVLSLAYWVIMWSCKWVSNLLLAFSHCKNACCPRQVKTNIPSESFPPPFLKRRHDVYRKHAEPTQFASVSCNYQAVMEDTGVAEEHFASLEHELSPFLRNPSFCFRDEDITPEKEREVMQTSLWCWTERERWRL